MKCHALGILCLPKYLFASIQNEKDLPTVKLCQQLNFTDDDLCTLHMNDGVSLNILRQLIVIGLNLGLSIYGKPPFSLKT